MREGGGEGRGGGVEVVTWNKSSESNRKKKKKKKKNKTEKAKTEKTPIKPRKAQRLPYFSFREREALVLHRKSVGSLSLGLYLVIVFSSVISA